MNLNLDVLDCIYKLQCYEALSNKQNQLPFHPCRTHPEIEGEELGAESAAWFLDRKGKRQ